MDKQPEFRTTADVEFLRGVIDSLPIPVFWKDLRSCYKGCNKAFLDYYRFGSAAEVANKDDAQMPWNAYADQL